MSLELASSTVALLAPYLGKSGEEFAKTFGKETANAVINLLSWLRAKLGNHGKDALDALEAQPCSQLNQEDLHVQLARCLERQPDLVSQLRQLLPAAPVGGGPQMQVVGPGGKAVQNTGNRNTTTIS
jgi:hypothetical protein